MEAYYAPNFSSNIVSANVISDLLEIFISSSLRLTKSCLLFPKGSLDVLNVTWETTCNKDLHPIQSSPLTQTSLMVQKNHKLMEDY